MRNTRHLRKSFLSRMIVTAVSIFMMISCIPDEILIAYGAEHHTENTTEKNSDDLKYRTICETQHFCIMQFQQQVQK